MIDLNNPTAKGSPGRQPAKALFDDGGIYNLQDFHDVFIACEDLTEYEPAIKLVGTWLEWERLKRDWLAFNAHIQRWKDELEVVFRSRAIRQVLTCAEDGNFQASKWIAEGGFDKRQGAGRPSKREKAKIEKEVAADAAETKADVQRVLHIMKANDG